MFIKSTTRFFQGSCGLPMHLSCCAGPRFACDPNRTYPWGRVHFTLGLVGCTIGMIYQGQAEQPRERESCFVLITNLMRGRKRSGATRACALRDTFFGHPVPVDTGPSEILSLRAQVRRSHLPAVIGSHKGPDRLAENAAKSPRLSSAQLTARNLRCTL